MNTSLSNHKSNRLLLTVLSILFSTSAFASTILVTNSAASGPGSLSSAVANANADPGGDKIVFSSGVSSIALGGTLVITSPVTIDGSSISAPGGKVAITGYGFDVQPSANGTTLTNLYISTNNLVDGNGILLEGSSDVVSNDVISGNFIGVYETGGSNTYKNNFIGTDITGTNVIGITGNGYGIYINGSGHDLITGNLISGNHVLYTGDPSLTDPSDSAFVIYGAGIWINNASAGNNTISNNKIGTDVTGTNVIENGSGILSYAGNNLIQQNQLAGFHVVSLAGPGSYVGGRGIIMMETGSKNMIQNNLFDGYINPKGQYVLLPNAADDVDLRGSNNTVQNNVMLGATDGAAVTSALTSGATSPTNNLIQYNFIGMDPKGNKINYLQNLGVFTDHDTNTVIKGNAFYGHDGMLLLFSNNLSMLNNQFSGQVGDTGARAAIDFLSNHTQVTGNLLQNEAQTFTAFATNSDVFSNNIVTGGSLVIQDVFANGTLYSGNSISKLLYTGPVTDGGGTVHTQTKAFLLKQTTSPTISNNIITGNGGGINAGPAVIETLGVNGLVLSGNVISNFPVALTADSGNSATLNADVITGLGQTSTNVSYGVQTTGTGNTITINNSSISNETYGLYGDSSQNVFSLTSNVFSNNFYALFDTSSAHNFTLSNNVFKNNTHNTN